MKALVNDNMNCMIETIALTGLYAGLLYLGSQFLLTLV